MKTFEDIPFNYRQAEDEVEGFRQLLARRPELEEQKDILPFFRHRAQLSALFSIFNVRISQARRVAWEYDLFGDLKCDLAVGSAEDGAYCFVEFEDAGPDSIFKREGQKATRSWSPRFDHGCSQIIDWFYKLQDMEKSDEYAARFGRRTISYEGLLVIGRDRHLDLRERLRLEWRSETTVISSRKIICVTFDDLLRRFQSHLARLSLVATTKRRGKT
jgi:hypothetical protein